MHRAASHGMVKADTEDPRAAKIRARKERKRAGELRTAIRTEGILGAAKLFIRTGVQSVASEECEDCRQLQQHCRALQARYTARHPEELPLFERAKTRADFDADDPTI